MMMASSSGEQLTSASSSFSLEMDFLGGGGGGSSNPTPRSLHFGSNESLFFERQGELVLSAEALGANGEWINCGDSGEGNSSSGRFLDLPGWSHWTQGEPMDLPEPSVSTEHQDNHSVRSSSFDHDYEPSFSFSSLDLHNVSTSSSLCFASFLDDSLPPLQDQYSSDSREHSSRLSEESFGTEFSSLMFEDHITSRKPNPPPYTTLSHDTATSVEKSGVVVDDELIKPPCRVSNNSKTRLTGEPLKTSKTVKRNRVEAGGGRGQLASADYSENKSSKNSTASKSDSQLWKLGAPPRPVASLTIKRSSSVPSKDSRRTALAKRGVDKVCNILKLDGRSGRHNRSFSEDCARSLISDTLLDDDATSFTSTTNSITHLYASDVAIDTLHPIVFHTKAEEKMAKRKSGSLSLPGVGINEKIGSHDAENLVSVKEFEGCRGGATLNCSYNTEHEDEGVDALFNDTFAGSLLCFEEDAYIYTQEERAESASAFALRFSQMIEEICLTPNPSNCSLQLKQRNISTEVVQYLSLESASKTADGDSCLQISACPSEVEISLRLRSDSEEDKNHSTIAEKECKPFVNGMEASLQSGEADHIPSLNVSKDNSGFSKECTELSEEMGSVVINAMESELLSSNEKEVFDDFGGDFLCMKTFGLYQNAESEGGKDCDVRHVKVSGLESGSGGEKGCITVVTLYKNPLWRGEEVFNFDSMNAELKSRVRESEDDIWESEMESATEIFRSSEESVVQLEEVFLLCTGFIPEDTLRSLFELFHSCAHDKSAEEEKSRNGVSVVITLKPTKLIYNIENIAIPATKHEGEELNISLDGSKDLTLHEIPMINSGEDNLQLELEEVTTVDCQDTISLADDSSCQTTTEFSNEDNTIQSVSSNMQVLVEG